MNSEERFKKSLQDLLSDKEFPFDEANWRKAEQVIAGSEKPRRMMLYVISGILFLGIISTGVYLLSDISPDTTKPLAIKTNSEKTAHSSGLNTKTIVKEPGLSAPAMQKTIVPGKSGTGMKGTNQVAAKENLPSELPKNTVVKKVVPATTGFSSALETTQATHNKSEAELTKKVDSSGKDVATLSVMDGKEKTEKTNPDGNTEKKKEVREQELSQAIIEPGSASTLNADGKNSQTSMERFANDNQNISPVNTVASDTEELLPDTESEPNADGTDNIEETNSLTAIPASPDSANTAVPTVQEPLLPDNNKDEAGKPKKYPVLFSVEAGASYLFGWQNGGTVDANGFNPLIGVNYFNNFSPKMSLTFGLHYSSVNNLSFSKYTSKIVRLGFGEESEVTVFTPVKLHYLIVPLRFNYDLTTLNTVGLGFNIAYLLTVGSEVESYTESVNTRYGQTLSKTNGYTEGFKQFDTQISLFYKRRLYPKLSLNAEVFYGLTDIKDNMFFNSNVFERNNGIKLTLVYNFLKR